MRVRQLLNEPHRLYRRVRDKDGNLKLSQAAQAYHPGRGVYRSSYKNAMRVARTEVNMAYQASDSERWTNSWWVKGIRICLSNNHTTLDSKGQPTPLVDICDDISGDYPPDFKFTGWHPQCRCYATAITCDYADIREYYRRKRAGEDMTGYTPPGAIKEPPAQFKRWLADNSDRLDRAAERGTTPYFINNNRKYTDPNWKPAPKKKTPIEISNDRHNARTSEDITKIKESWAKNRQRKANIKIVANNVLGLRTEYPFDVDFSALEKAIADGNLRAMQHEAKRVGQAIKAVRIEEKQLSDLIPNARGWHKLFTIAELRGVDANVRRTIRTKGWNFDIDDAAGLDKLRSGLEHEVRWMETKGQKFKTWEVARSAYQEKLAWARKRIDMLDQKIAVEREMDILRKSRSKQGKQLVADFEALFKSDATDLATLKAKAADIRAKSNSLQRKSSKNTPSPASTASFRPMTDTEAKKALVDYAKQIGTAIDPAKIVVDKGFIHLQGDQHLYLYCALKPESSAEHLQLWSHCGGGGAHYGMGGYVQTGNSWLINSAFRKNGIFGKINTANETLLRKAGMTDDDLKTIRLLDKKIDEFSLPIPMLATRYVELPALENIFGTKVTGMGTGGTDASLKSWADAIRSLPNKKIVADPAFLSASTNETQNVFFRTHKVKLQIEIPPGTPMHLTNNYDESEIILSRGTRLDYRSVDVKEMADSSGRVHKHVTIRCRVKYSK